MNPTADGTTKKPTRLVLAAILCRSVAATCSSVPSALDIAGSSAAEIDMPNRLTGSM